MSILDKSIKIEVGQHFICGFHGHEVGEDIKTLIQDYHLGAIILMKRNIQSLSQIRKIVDELQATAREAGHLSPLLIGIDQENGLVSALSSSTHDEAGTQFPGAMAQAATNSLNLTKRIAYATAQELRFAGINWVFSPVCDVNSDPRNPVIGVRSFGDDPKDVGAFASAVVQGFNEGGVASCAKHAPGHGETSVDSHLDLPLIPKSEKQLEETELAPFRAVIDAGVPSLMTGHMALPKITNDNVPSSLSHQITTGLMRSKLGYEQGVIVTDCLEMQAVLDNYGTAKGAVMSLQAGADVVMICHTFAWQRQAIEEVYRALETGDISLEALRVSGGRVKRLKESFVTPLAQGVIAPPLVGLFAELKRDNKALSVEAYAASIALSESPSSSSAIPLQSLAGKSKVALFTPVMETLNKAVDDADGVLRNEEPAKGIRNTAGASYLSFFQSIKERAPAAMHIVYSQEVNLGVESLKDIDAIIFTTRNAGRSPWQVEYLQRLLSVTEGVPIIGVASCEPYDLAVMEKFGIPALATFEFTSPALEAAVGVIFGEKKATARLPVKIL